MMNYFGNIWDNECFLETYGMMNYFGNIWDDELFWKHMG